MHAHDSPTSCAAEGDARGCFKDAGIRGWTTFIKHRQISCLLLPTLPDGAAFKRCPAVAACHACDYLPGDPLLQWPDEKTELPGCLGKIGFCAWALDSGERRTHLDFAPPIRVSRRTRYPLRFRSIMPCIRHVANEDCHATRQPRARARNASGNSAARRIEYERSIEDERSTGRADAAAWRNATKFWPAQRPVQTFAWSARAPSVNAIAAQRCAQPATHSGCAPPSDASGGGTFSSHPGDTFACASAAAPAAPATQRTDSILRARAIAVAPAMRG
ncbi:hypothetical protein XTALMG727_3596 [Xanthomonas translucens pv. arrhenatheri LMG 727]|uniref:Uncharacterized protein n=1 Tax=Xanthomonas graminis pv. arrhenatheri LMG 727 TaxID=1195923 RepID=A0A0K3A1Z9_9XANT|nr:hypothetical protein XTALMG727_3596 [Xanthomonas translucens pv. arrhenatheri LMG 727]